MRKNLLSWQFQLYAGNHTRRRTLVIHACTAPLFVWGCLTLACAALRPLFAIFGLAAMFLALVFQGSAHKKEPAAPVPFLGPGDFVSRFFVEQWVTFPRFILSGGFARAWLAESASVGRNGAA